MIVILMSLVGLVGTKPKEQVKNDQPEVFNTYRRAGKAQVQMTIDPTIQL